MTEWDKQLRRALQDCQLRQQHFYGCRKSRSQPDRRAVHPTQTHDHWVSDANQPAHPLLSPSPPALNLSQHQGLFKWISSPASGGQSIGVSASTSVLPMNTQDSSPLGWTGWISLQSKGLSRVFSNTTVQKVSILYRPTLTSIHNYWKTIALTRRTFVGKVMPLLFNMLSRLVITSLPRSKRL